MIEAEQFVERRCRLGADRGPRPFPRARKDREILIKSIRLLLDSSRSYSEPELNAELVLWNADIAPSIEIDHVTLRRLQVDYGHLERTADGRAYRVGFPGRPSRSATSTAACTVCPPPPSTTPLTGETSP